MYDVIIIGAGAAGMMAACHCAGLDTVVLEANQRPLKKLEISGSGRCNVSHDGDIADFFSHYGEGQERFVRPALYEFDNTATVAFFKQWGVETLVLENGKIFPEAPTAMVLSEALLNAAKAAGAKLVVGSKVISVEHHEQVFSVTVASGETYESKALLLSGGGLSFYNTGSDGSCLQLAKLLGHSLNPPKPALTPVYVDQSQTNIASLAGTVLEDVELTLICAKTGKEKKLHGQLLFTHRGLSGPVILDGSRYMNQGDTLCLNFAKQNLSASQVEQNLVQLANQNGSGTLLSFIKKNAKTIKTGEFVFELSTGGKDYRISELPKQLRKTVAQNLCAFAVRIHSMGGYEVAMATHGGVSLAEINSKTMESRLVKNLYFAGEIMDIDGDTGGYNIQWAFSSGVLAVRSMKSGLGR